MTSSSISRRSALGVLGTGSALAFAGCAARVQPLSADASTSYRADYSGEVTFNSYDTSQENTCAQPVPNARRTCRNR